MDDYVPKPFKPGELRERVEHWALKTREKKGPQGVGREEGEPSATPAAESLEESDMDEVRSGESRKKRNRAHRRSSWKSSGPR